MRVDLSSAIARPGYAPRLGRKSLYLFASALFAVSGAAAAQTTELDCADRTHPDHHWSVTLERISTCMNRGGFPRG